ncbi:MAG: hypothetical protein IPO14_04580 [Saprospiraceae bacterium]|nr:hypothetical protein [Saprospiraceae bacterium]
MSGVFHPQSQNVIVSPSVTTIYTVTVTGANGCMATDEVRVVSIHYHRQEEQAQIRR